MTTFLTFLAIVLGLALTVFLAARAFNWWVRRTIRLADERAAKAKIEEMRSRREAERSIQSLREFMAKRAREGTATADERRMLDELRREDEPRRRHLGEAELLVGRPLMMGEDWGAGPSRSNHSSGGGYGGDGYSTGGGFGGGSHSSSSSYDSSSSSDSGSSSSSSCGSD